MSVDFVMRGGVLLASVDSGIGGPPPTPGGGSTFRDVDTMVYMKYGAPLRTISYTTYGKHEQQIIVGDPGWGWYEGAYPGVDPGPYPSGQWGWHNTWGQVLNVAGGTPERRVRLHVAKQEVWHLVSGTWTQKKTDATLGQPEGAYYQPASFSGGRGMTASDWRAETEGYSIDLTPLTNTDGSANTTTGLLHWWYTGTWPRIAMVSTTTAVAIVCKMKLIANVTGAAVSTAKFAAAFCGDVYDGPEVAVSAGGINPGFDIPRHQMITDQWKSFGFVTGTEASIRAYATMPFLAATPP